MAFLDIHPVQPGMVLVVTKTPYESFIDVPAEDYQALWGTVQKVAQRMKITFPDKKRIGVQVEGLDVPHVHVKLLPINTGEEYRAKPNLNTPVDPQALAAMAKKLAF